MEVAPVRCQPRRGHRWSRRVLIRWRPFRRLDLKRRARGRETEEPFGGGGEWSALEGAGFLTLAAERDRLVTVFDLAGEFVYVRESALLGFDSSARYENGRLPGTLGGQVPVVQFSGNGLVLIESERRPSSLVVSAERPLMLRSERVQRDLFAGGYDAEDVMQFNAGDVIPQAQGQLDNADWLARLGRADEMVQTHLNAAQGGSTFLLVHAPSDDEAQRVMNVARRVPFQFAHHYRRFAIETLK